MSWLNAAILFLLFAGHCELMAVWVNRLHALPFRRSVLKPTRIFHDLLVLAFVPLVVWKIGLTGPRLLSGGEWSQLPTGWAIYFALCLLGVGSLLWAIAKEARRRTPEIRSSELIDMAEELGFAPAGPGWRGKLASVPGNEVFLLEINEKEFFLPHLPPELDGLSIAHFSDVHFRGPIDLDYFRRVFERISAMSADLIAFTGDLLDEEDKAEWLPETFGRLSAPLGCWFILGNHDWLLDAGTMRKAMVDLGWNDLGPPTETNDPGELLRGRTVLFKHESRAIAIAGDERPWFGEFPPGFEKGTGELSILLSHTPDNLREAAQNRVDLVLSGHNHGGQVRLPLIGPVYSPSRYGVRYASGTFQQGRTILHVSRGVSAERPLRWNCPPEITKIVLRSRPQ